jgi:tripartite-type tricarboxylate transporter receptor subunit TctC
MFDTKLNRRAAIIGGVAATMAFGASAQDYPAKVLRIIVAFGPGGSGDSIARLYGQKMSEILKVPVIVENKPGGNQMLAIRTLMSSPPDGSTLYLATGSSLVQNPALRKGLGYDPLKDFTLIGLLATLTGVVFTDPKLPVHSIKELVAYANAHPDKANYGSAGVGSAGHLAGEALLAATGAKMTHVAYKSDSDVIREVMGSNVQMGIMTTLNTVSAVKAGNIRALAVTSSKRLPILPDVPSLAETGFKGLEDLEPHTFHSLVGPAGKPAALVTQLNEAINKVSADPDVANKVRNFFYAEPGTGSPASFRAFVEKELVKWTTIGKTVKLSE